MVLAPQVVRIQKRDITGAWREVVEARIAGAAWAAVFLPNDANARRALSADQLEFGATIGRRFVVVDDDLEADTIEPGLVEHAAQGPSENAGLSLERGNNDGKGGHDSGAVAWFAESRERV